MPAKSVLLSVRSGSHVRPFAFEYNTLRKGWQAAGASSEQKQAPAFKFWRLRIIFDFSEASYQYLLAETGVR